MRVTASDEISNPPDRVTKDACESGVVLVDNTPHATVNPDDGGQLNWVSRKGIGECAGVTQ